MKVIALHVMSNGTQYLFETLTGREIRVDVSTQLSNSGGIMIQVPQKDVDLYYVAPDDKQYLMTGTELANREGFLEYILVPGIGDRFIIKVDDEFAMFLYEPTGFRFINTETPVQVVSNA